MFFARNMRVPALACLLLNGCLFSKDADPPPPDPEPVWFSNDVTGLEFAKAPSTKVLKNGDTIVLNAAPVKKSFHGHEVRMLAYNGSIPGPMIQVPQGATITLILRNHTGFKTSLHSHGVRLDYLYDGASGFSQKPIANDSSFSYRIHFPDAGLFWYHPHTREDYEQEMGLYGNFSVTSPDSAYWNPVNREQTLILDDFYLDPATATAPFRTDGPSHTMMGRFGNIFMVNGDTNYTLEVKRKEVVRFYFTNASNVRTFHLGFTPDPTTTSRYIPLKIIGADNGKYEYDTLLPNEFLAPSERTVLETYFDTPGDYFLLHDTRFPVGCLPTQDSVYVMGRVRVLSDSVSTGYGRTFPERSAHLETIRSIDSVRSRLDTSVPPDKILFLTVKLGQKGDGADMPLMKASAAQHDPGDVVGKCIEWYDNMPGPNAQSTVDNVRWIVRDSTTGAENHDINWRFKQGSKVKIRIVNDGLRSVHPMPHPIHFHGQRFLVGSVNGIPNRNMAWKDSYLVGVGQAVDILLDASNPGGWMAHCHIAEHLEDGMMFPFYVDP
ncbi:MAG TPA: hypothetical protein DCQ83_05980 [Fibrobacteres bacterium]|jgi:suppressor of ftsI|nr:hypothetical protein [Fibrobacterota bacterium]